MGPQRYRYCPCTHLDKDNHTEWSQWCFKGRTVCLRGRGSSPLLDAVQVEDVEAALAAPHRGHAADDVAADHALVLLLRQLLDQTPCGGKRSEGQETREFTSLTLKT